jgi:polyisoprenoid-binding protein YceI
VISLGPDNATLTVLTRRAGAIAKAGHDLVIEVTRWRATLAPDAIELTVDAGSLRVRSGSGGISPLGDEEKAGIAQTIDEEVLKGGSIVFRSSSVTERPDGLDVEGELELLGIRRPLAFELTLNDGHLTGSATVKQTDWQMKPYSALFGTLKVADDVEIAIDATLPRSIHDG